MPKTLLLADDSITIQKVVGIIFSSEESKDYAVTAVDNGEDALSKVRELRPDVLLADAVMPRKNGYELCEAIKNDPELRSTPVLLLAGTFEAFDEARARAVGADGWIAKPFESALLINKVREIVEGIAPPAPAAQPWSTPAPRATPAAVPPPPGAPLPPGARPLPGAAPFAAPPPVPLPRPPVPPPPPFAARPPMPPAPPPPAWPVPPPAPVFRDAPTFAAPRPPAPPAAPSFPAPPPPPSFGAPPPTSLAPPPAPAVPLTAVPAAPSFASAPPAPPVVVPLPVTPPPAPAIPTQKVAPTLEPDDLDFDIDEAAAPIDLEELAAEEITEDEELLAGERHAEVAPLPSVASAPEPFATPADPFAPPGSPPDPFASLFEDEARTPPEIDLASRDQEFAPPALDLSAQDSFGAPEAAEEGAASTSGAFHEGLELEPEPLEPLELQPEPTADLELQPEPTGEALDLAPAPQPEPTGALDLAAEPQPGPATPFLDGPEAVGQPFAAEPPAFEAAAGEPLPFRLEPEPQPEPEFAFQGPLAPEPAVAAASADEAVLRDVLSRASRETIERVVWEVVPQLAEVIIREHLERLMQDRKNS